MRRAMIAGGGCAGRWNEGLVRHAGTDLGDANGHVIRCAFLVFPVELSGKLSRKHVIHRDRVVMIHEHEMLSGRERQPTFENESAFVGAIDLADIETGKGGGGHKDSSVGLGGRGGGGGYRGRSVGFGAKGQQQGAGSVDGAQGVRMMRRQLQQCPRLESLPTPAEQEIAVPAEDLDERAPAVGVLGELLTDGKGKEYHANRRRIEQSAAYDPALRKLEQVGQNHGGGSGGVQWNGTRHVWNLAQVAVRRVDLGQDRDGIVVKAVCISISGDDSMFLAARCFSPRRILGRARYPRHGGQA